MAKYNRSMFPFSLVCLCLSISDLRVYILSVVRYVWAVFPKANVGYLIDVVAQLPVMLIMILEFRNPQRLYMICCEI